MQYKWLIAGIVFLICGALELLFFALAVLGTLTGGLMGVAGALDGQGEAAFMGGAIFLIYGFWLFCTIIPALLHFVAGGMMVTGKQNRKVAWAATVASAFPMFTLYCAPTSLLALAAGLIALLVPDEQPA